MTLLYTDPIFLEHDTGQHPECRARLEAITARLDTDGLAARCQKPEWQSATVDQLARAHARDYIDQVRAFAEKGGGRIEADTMVSRQSYAAATRAAGAAIDATTRVLTGDDRRALCLVRPPGHHALRDDAMGFCLFSNAALAAHAALAEQKLNRVLIVDWDVHHGNGTQDAFWTDGRVGFLSIHRWPFYPGTGRAEETGSGRGQGMICNLPTEMGVSRTDFQAKFASALGDFAARVKPELVIISAGFDAHRADPIGSLGLESEDFIKLTDVVLDVADAHAGGRVVSLLEGGYNVNKLAECVSLHLQRLLERPA
ncbi:MAG: histone deacetylase [Planctomycetes bacterium]|nr:histone deacetylase [Planctomycetota bacterium]